MRNMAIRTQKHRCIWVKAKHAVSEMAETMDGVIMSNKIYETKNGTLIDISKICYITPVEYYNGAYFVFVVHFIGSDSNILYTADCVEYEANKERQKIKEAWTNYLGD